MTTRLNLADNIAEHDDFYELLIDTHQGLNDEQSKMLNAQLILILANHIGELAVLRHAMALARDSVLGSQ